MARKKPRKIINGVAHVQCIHDGCEKWIEEKPGKYRCNEHRREFYAKYQDKYRGRYSGRYQRSNPTPNYYSKEVVEEELKGKCRIRGGLYKECTPEQVAALQSGNVNELLRARGRDD